VATAQDGDATLAAVLEHGQLLGKGIDAIDIQKIQGPRHQ
jgi:hypothetical protein